MVLESTPAFNRAAGGLVSVATGGATGERRVGGLRAAGGRVLPPAARETCYLSSRSVRP
jgi:hypothetical protein